MVLFTPSCTVVMFPDNSETLFCVVSIVPSASVRAFVSILLIFISTPSAPACFIATMSLDGCINPVVSAVTFVVTVSPPDCLNATISADGCIKPVVSAVTFVVTVVFADLFNSSDDVFAPSIFPLASSAFEPA